VEDPSVTSETAFSQSFSSTWRMLTPATDLFVRKVNSILRQREFAPLKSTVLPERRGFINEAAFEFFRIRREWFNFSRPRDELMSRAAEAAKATICRIERIDPAVIPDPSEAEGDELLAIAERLQMFFSRESNGRSVQVHPKFPGCGIIDTCLGDVCFGDTLYEVKAGDRTFRSMDLRQLLIYAALSKAARMSPLRHVGLLNPRTGVSFSSDLDGLCLEVSGTRSEELLAEIVRVISSGDTSR
jgi:hypothetical protein